MRCTNVVTLTTFSLHLAGFRCPLAYPIASLTAAECRRVRPRDDSSIQSTLPVLSSSPLLSQRGRFAVPRAHTRGRCYRAT